MEKIKPYAKFVAALVTAGLIAAEHTLPLNATWHGWIAVALAVFGAAAVYKVENADLPPKDNG